MKLLSHNMLTSNMIKGVKDGYPLGLIVKNFKSNELDYDESLIKKLIPKLCWKTFISASKCIKPETGLPEELPKDYENNESFLKMAYKYLINVEIVDGEMKCPQTGHVFPIENGIPNMLINKDKE
ncbi:tRNA methyltransferase [Intoshia linei]|uniref:Multifunctional methyltransferase subunit TRM112-like protein n=1 Tax=Intoshia linei TaxID=1819745 RepID=A0A177B4M1_9BILA|nr:tRNA methyltransferase [Intoshia linei]